MEGTGSVTINTTGVVCTGPEPLIGWAETCQTVVGNSIARAATPRISTINEQTEYRSQGKRAT